MEISRCSVYLSTRLVAGEMERVAVTVEALEASSSERGLSLFGALCVEVRGNQIYTEAQLRNESQTVTGAPFSRSIDVGSDALGAIARIDLLEGEPKFAGEKFDAEAAKFSLDRHMTMQGSFRKPELAAVDKVEVVDPLTI